MKLVRVDDLQVVEGRLVVDTAHEELGEPMDRVVGVEKCTGCKDLLVRVHTNQDG